MLRLHFRLRAHVIISEVISSCGLHDLYILPVPRSAWRHEAMLGDSACCLLGRTVTLSLLRGACAGVRQFSVHVRV